MFGSKFLGGNIWGANIWGVNSLNEKKIWGGGVQNGEQFLFKANFLGRKF